MRSKNDMTLLPALRNSNSLVMLWDCKTKVNQSKFITNFHNVTRINIIVDIVVAMKGFQNFKNVNYNIAGNLCINLSDFLANHTSDNVWEQTIKVFIQQPWNTHDIDLL